MNKGSSWVALFRRNHLNFQYYVGGRCGFFFSLCYDLYS